MASDCVTKTISEPESPKNRIHGEHILRKWLNLESYLGIIYKMTVINPEMVICTDFISY